MEPYVSLNPSIPGTSSLAHFKENLKAADISLTDEDMLFLD